MSWLAKVTDIAGKAEDLLNRFDQSTGDVITHTKENIRGRGSASSSTMGLNRPPASTDVHDEIGGSYAPSVTQSEYVGGASAGRKRTTGGAAPSGSRLSTRDDQLMSMLQGEPGGNSFETRSQGGGGANWFNQPDTGNQSEGRSRRSSSHSIASLSVSEAPDVSGMRTQLLAKDSQLSTLRQKLTETEKKLASKSEELWDMKREKETLARELRESKQPSESVDELRAARQKAVDARECVVAELSELKRKMLTAEEENHTLNDQLRLAKFNLAENKREFDEYKDKAHKILQAKEKLVESLKNDTSPEGGILPAELEELRVERDMARADLESCQLQIYNLRSEMDEQESRIRDQQRELAEKSRSLLEERAQWQASIQILNEKVECARIEQEFARAEMRRQEEEMQRKVEEKDTELRRAMEEQRSRRREEEYRSGASTDMATAERLIHKQAELEQALRDNQILQLRLERLQKNTKDTVINMGEQQDTTYTQPSLRASIPVQNPTARQLLTVIDMVCSKFISMLRNNPFARLFFFAYFVVLHLWVFFIIMTYTPEMHP